MDRLAAQGSVPGKRAAGDSEDGISRFEPQPGAVKRAKTRETALMGSSTWLRPKAGARTRVGRDFQAALPSCEPGPSCEPASDLEPLEISECPIKHDESADTGEKNMSTGDVSADSGEKDMSTDEVQLSGRG